MAMGTRSNEHLPSDIEESSDVAKPEWGTKRTCQSCGAKFYDLGKEPVICPSCATVFDLKAAKTSSSASAAKAKPKPEKEVKKKRVVAAEPGEEGEIEAIDDEDLDDEVLADDEEALEDTADLGEDDALQEVIEDDPQADKE